MGEETMNKMIHYRQYKLGFTISLILLSLQSFWFSRGIFDFTDFNLFGMPLLSLSTLIGIAGLYFAWQGWNARLRLQG